MALIIVMVVLWLCHKYTNKRLRTPKGEKQNG